MEQRTAARFSGYTWQEYDELPGDPWYKEDGQADCKAEVIAYYRTSKTIESIEDSVRNG